MYNSTQVSLCPSEIGIHQCIWIEFLNLLQDNLELELEFKLDHAIFKIELKIFSSRTQNSLNFRIVCSFLQDFSEGKGSSLQLKGLSARALARILKLPVIFERASVIPNKYCWKDSSRARNSA